MQFIKFALNGQLIQSNLNFYYNLYHIYSTKIMDQPKTAAVQPAHKHKKSKGCLAIEIVILLAVVCAVSVSLIYYFGTDQIHTDVPHVLDEIFGTQPHKDLVTDLNKKTNQHAVLYGANQTGIFQFLEHYADVRASKGGLVIVKRVENNFYETALKFIRYTKEYIEDNINLESQLEKVQWIFIVRNGQAPLDEIQRIRTKRLKDRIVVGLAAKSSIKGFKAIKFPAVPLEVVQDVIKADFGVSTKQASILTNYYGSIPQILHHLNQISYTHQKHLGPNYQNLKDLGKTELKTLKTLCAKGTAPLQGNRAALEQIGVVAFDGKVYWQQRINRLNYELSLEVQCVDKVVPSSIRESIAKQREDQSKAEIEAEAEVEVPTATQQKSTKTNTATQKAGKSKQAKKTTIKAATTKAAATKPAEQKSAKSKSKVKPKANKKEQL